MALSDLPTALQTIEIYNFEMLMRSLWIFMLIVFSALYIFYFYPKAKKTEFFSIAITRIIIMIFSVINLATIPLMLFGLSPEIDVWTFILPYMTIYYVLILAYTILSNADLFRYGIPILLKSAGLMIEDPDTNKVYRKWKKFLNKNGRGIN